MAKGYDLDNVKIKFNGLTLKSIESMSKCARRFGGDNAISLDSLRTLERKLLEAARLPAHIITAVSDTSFDIDDDDVPTYPPAHYGYVGGQPIYAVPQPAVNLTHGQDLPARKCKGCRNNRMVALYQHQEWVAFCKLCGKTEVL